MFRRALLTVALIGATASHSAFAQSCDTSFTLQNNAGRQINEIYFSPTTDNAWGSDRLGANVLPAGRSVSYRPAPPGRYDFRVVFEGGQALEQRNVDLCTVSTITVTAQGISAQ